LVARAARKVRLRRYCLSLQKRSENFGSSARLGAICAKVGSESRWLAL
jgi:hypothetical protein